MNGIVIFLVLLVHLSWAKPTLTSENGDALREDDPCTLHTQTSGICKPVSECPSAIEAIQKRRFDDLIRCGFLGTIEIVCCESNELTTDFTTTRRRHRTTTESIVISYTEPITTRWNLIPNRTNEDENHIRDRSSDRVVGAKAKQACAQYSNKALMPLTYHILGGENAELGQFPHMAALGYEYEGSIHFDCGGTLISDRYVLTAAHCIFRNDDNEVQVVRLGVINLTSPTYSDYSVESKIVHPNYKGTAHYYDIALIKLARSVTFTDNIGPACLNLSKDPPGRGLVITGWGITDFLQGEQSVILQKATLEYVPQQECREMYQSRSSFRLRQGIQETQMCANYGSGPRRDACSGDSGGPIQIQNPGNTNIWTVVGITSFGVGCGSRIPGVYTRVEAYIEWIENIVWPN